ncbi:MAG TPA: hypothetical protein VMV06_07215 [Acidimicrobiales bacterium]|nr:hypothetical protein [Acidimicrobiales bacterium]
MKRLNGVTVLFLSLAFLWSAALTVWIFVVDIPVTPGSHRLVQTASGGHEEVIALPRTYFQAYGVSELLLASMGLVLACLVAFLLHQRSRDQQPNAGSAAWGVSISALVVGIIGFLGIAPYMFFVGIVLIGACLSYSARQFHSREVSATAIIGSNHHASVR